MCSNNPYPNHRVTVELQPAATYPASRGFSAEGRWVGTTVLPHLLAQPPSNHKKSLCDQKSHLNPPKAPEHHCCRDRDFQTPRWGRCFAPPLHIHPFDELWNYCMLIISKTCCNYVMIVVKEIKWCPRSHPLIIWYLINDTIYFLTSLSNYAEF